jgi:hypothetical protein
MSLQNKLLKFSISPLMGAIARVERGLKTSGSSMPLRNKTLKVQYLTANGRHGSG